jgi:hypothetical protein
VIAAIKQGDLVEGRLGSRAWVESPYSFIDGREGWWLRSVKTGLGVPVTDKWASESLTVIDPALDLEAS